MPIRHADATWTGGLKDGTGAFRLGSGAVELQYSFATRFAQTPGSNPEELLGAAHAACFSMALSATLEKAGHKPRRVHTTAAVSIDKVGEGFKITRITLTTEADVPKLEPAKFHELAEQAKKGCPVSQALAGTDIQLQATLNNSNQ